jgi:hypothetical protein
VKENAALTVAEKETPKILFFGVFFVLRASEARPNES